MATTTNYSWTTPDDTALVKDGAAAIRSLGTAIDTTVFTNAGAAIAKTIVDAKGDLIAATAADTVARLAVGANDTVLIADSSTATGLKWGTPSAGGMTLLSTTTLSGATTTISSISGAYKSLYCIIDTPQNSTTNGQWLCRPNNDSDVKCAGSYVNQTTTQNFYVDYGIPLSFGIDILRSNGDSYAVFQIDNYASTAITRKGVSGYGTFRNSGNSGNLYGIYGGSHYLFNTAITSLVFLNSGGNASAGTVYLYGVN
jgi:hypothetical protein